MGFWSSNANIGNILGFALTGIILDVFRFSWETAMFVIAAIQVFIAFQVYCGIEENPEELASLMEEEVGEEGEVEGEDEQQSNY